MGGNADITDDVGYSFRIEFHWQAAAPRIDVGSNPPGKTNILVAAEPYTATFTNTTTGGRELPAERLGTDPAVFVALYPARSVVCAQKDESGNLDDTLLAAEHGIPGGTIRTEAFCAVKIILVLDDARVGGALDTGTALPNGTPIQYGFGALADSAGADPTSDPSYAQPVADGPSWSGLVEADSMAIRTALASPIGFGIDTGRNMPSGASCSYKNEGNGDPEYVALLTSNTKAPAPIPGCS